MDSLAFEKSALFARYLLDCGHTGGDEILLHFEDKYARRLGLENIEIAKKDVHHDYDLINRAMNDNSSFSM